MNHTTAVPARSIEKSNRGRSDAKLPKKNDGRSGVGLSEKREAASYAGGQRKVRGPLPKLAVLSQTGHAPEKGPPSFRVRPGAVDGAIHPDEHTERFRDQLLQVDEQLGVRQNDE